MYLYAIPLLWKLNLTSYFLYWTPGHDRTQEDKLPKSTLLINFTVSFFYTTLRLWSIIPHLNIFIIIRLKCFWVPSAREDGKKQNCSIHFHEEERQHVITINQHTTFSLFLLWLLYPVQNFMRGPFVVSLCEANRLVFYMVMLIRWNNSI